MPLAVLLNPDDPIYDFEHMMAHREYFAVMQPRHGFSVLPYLLDPAFATEEPAVSWNLNHQQAHNDFNSALPGSNADGFTITVVTPPAATALGTAAGTTSLTLTSVSHPIIVGASVVGAGVPVGTTIVGQQSGPAGGNGVYITNQPMTITNIPVTVAHPPYQQANPTGPHPHGIDAPGILIEGNGGSAGNQDWWAFVNHQQHYVANDNILPLPTTAPTTAGTPPGEADVSNPWWWVDVAPILYPYW